MRERPRATANQHPRRARHGFTWQRLRRDGLWVEGTDIQVCLPVVSTQATPQSRPGALALVWRLHSAAFEKGSPPARVSFHIPPHRQVDLRLLAIL